MFATLKNFSTFALPNQLIDSVKSHRLYCNFLHTHISVVFPFSYYTVISWFGDFGKATLSPFISTFNFFTKNAKPSKKSLASEQQYLACNGRFTKRNITSFLNRITRLPLGSVVLQTWKISNRAGNRQKQLSLCQWKNHRRNFSKSSRTFATFWLVSFIVRQ